MQITRVGTVGDFEAVLALIRESFATMDGRIDPPSSMHQLTVEALALGPGEVWAIDTRACVVLTPKSDALYVGKLAVAQAARGQGLAQALMGRAAERAVALGLPALELEVRIELVENQKMFAGMGFSEVGRTSHPGYDRATSITMRKDLA